MKTPSHVVLDAIRSRLTSFLAPTPLLRAPLQLQANKKGSAATLEHAVLHFDSFAYRGTPLLL